MNKKKVYIPPYSEVVLVKGQICEANVHMTMMSQFDNGHNSVTPITYGDGEGGAKGQGWDLWDDYQGFDEKYNKW